MHDRNLRGADGCLKKTSPARIANFRVRGSSTLSVAFRPSTEASVVQLKSRDAVGPNPNVVIRIRTASRLIPWSAGGDR